MTCFFKIFFNKVKPQRMCSIRTRQAQCLSECRGASCRASRTMGLVCRRQTDTTFLSMGHRYVR